MHVTAAASDRDRSLADLTSIRMSYGSCRALDAVSIALRPGEMMGLVGPNGAGKTTLLRILTGLETRFEGLVAWHRRPSFGFLPQSVAFGPWRSARETLDLLGQLSGMSAAQLSVRVPEVISAVGLADVSDLRVGTFSGGMRQRLGLAQAMLHSPEPRKPSRVSSLQAA